MITFLLFIIALPTLWWLFSFGVGFVEGVHKELNK